MMLAGSGLICHVAQADDFYFDPSLLETNKSGLQTVDLSAFSQDSAQLPGEYIVDIYINNKKLTQRKIPFIAGDNHQLIPQFTVGQLRELGFKVDEIPALAKLDDAAKVTNLAQTVPNSSSELDLNHGKLNMSVPQIMLYRDARGYVDPPAGTMASRCCSPTITLPVQRAATTAASAAGASI